MRNFRIVLVILSLSLFGAACSKKADDPKKPANNAAAPEMKADEAMTPPVADMPADGMPADMPATTAEGDMTATTDATPVAPAADTPEPKLVCTNLIPEELQKKQGLSSVKAASTVAKPRTMDCPFQKGTESYSASFDCPTWDDNTFKETLERRKKAMEGAKDVEGLGRMAYVGNKYGIVMLTFWDDDTSCYVTIPGKDEAFIIAFAKDLAASLKPATIQ
ncbi:hypothetical protein KJ975_05155 [Myxococcota bacterium]|nr:hypothetical protein [Myxococcota bacterium]